LRSSVLHNRYDFNAVIIFRQTFNYSLTSTMRQSHLVKDLRVALGGENVISAPSELEVYDCDAFTLSRNPPAAVVFPQSTEQVAAVVRICNQQGIAIVPRGAGTGLAGGCMPVGHCVVLMLTPMKRVLDVNIRDRWALVEAGVYNSQLTKALAGTGCFFAAEPYTQGASSIGGNVATNASGADALKCGKAVNHILGLEAVLSDGSIIQLGPVADPACLDLLGLVVGSEGTLAIVTKVWLRLTPIPRSYRTMRAIFNSVEGAVNAVTQILNAGLLPSTIDLLDQSISAAMNGSLTGDCPDFHNSENGTVPLIPSDAGHTLLVKLGGLEADLDRQQEQIVSLLKKNSAKDVRLVSSAEDREMLWKSRKSAVTAAVNCTNFRSDPGLSQFSNGENGTVPFTAHSYLIEDCIVPRTRLPQMLQKIADISEMNQTRIMTVAHAGEGNVHPIILYDERDQASVARALAACNEIFQQCIALGGSVTGEHGVGARKVDFMPRQFQSPDLESLRRVRHSFDPYGLLNPGKVFSVGGGNELHNGVTEITEKN
jgi:glycolate dehydrogenase FAD-linked subunit